MTNYLTYKQEMKIYCIIKCYHILFETLHKCSMRLLKIHLLLFNFLFVVLQFFRNTIYCTILKQVNINLVDNVAIKSVGPFLM